MDGKEQFSKNLNNLMIIHNVSRRKLSDDLKISYFTVTDWVKGRKFPRMDKIEMIAEYFNVSLSDLVSTEELQEDSYELCQRSKFEWQKEFKNAEFTKEEIQKLFEYARFLISQRK